MSEDEIKESVDNEVDVLHAPGVELRAALIVRTGREVAVLHGVVQHPGQAAIAAVARGLRGHVLVRTGGADQAEDEGVFDEMHALKCPIQYASLLGYALVSSHFTSGSVCIHIISRKVSVPAFSLSSRQTETDFRPFVTFSVLNSVQSEKKAGWLELWAVTVSDLMTLDQIVD